MLASSTNPNATSTLNASTTPDIFGLLDQTLMSPSSSTADTSSWRVYSDKAARYSIRYPANLSVNADVAGALVLAFPKDLYFHWPLLDDAKVTISAGSSCPAVPSNRPNSEPVALTVNGYAFSRIEGGDVGAGNIYRELAYDTEAKGVCYHIDLLDHGTNGAGFYVGDQSLITSYDSAHTDDLSSVIDIFNGIVNTFRLTENML
jgi:hypothetical protein